METTREHDEDSNRCPGCGDDRMVGHKMNCAEPLADTVADVATELHEKHWD